MKFVFTAYLFLLFAQSFCMGGGFFSQLRQHLSDLELDHRVVSYSPKMVSDSHQAMLVEAINRNCDHAAECLLNYGVRLTIEHEQAFNLFRKSLGSVEFLA